MEVSRLYVSPFLNKDLRADPGGLLTPGYLGVQALKNQLLRIQAVATPSGKTVRYEIPGDTSKIENKKDTFMAFLYACYSLRQIILASTKKDHNVPVAYGQVISLPNSFMGNRKR